MKTKVLAIDIGASSGRGILGEYQDGMLTTREIHRFENVPVKDKNMLCWDIERLMREIRAAVEKADGIESLAFDAWGVDFGMLDGDGELVAKPVHYRDERTKDSIKKAFGIMPAAELYRETGNQMLSFNTLYQLLCTNLEGVDKILFMPDLFAYLLCGAAFCEYSVASTSQMLNPVTRSWSLKTLKAFQIDDDLFAPLIKSGTVIGEYQGVKVIAVAGHDTQCACAAMPADPCETAAFLSCGTWSLLGCELDEPVLTGRSKRLELSNEIGANGKINYLKNITGLWLLQETRRQYRREGREYGFAEIEAMARDAAPWKSAVDPDDERFLTGGNIPKKIREYCKETQQPVPQTDAEVFRCIYDSLALKYRFALEQIETITKKHFTTLHILGGGAKDSLLCQTAATCCRVRVAAGPVEATAMGNIIIQLIALGKLKDVEQGRMLIRNTQKIAYYLPAPDDVWEQKYSSFKERLMKQF